VQPGDIGDAGKRIEKAREAGQQEARVNSERGQCRRQRGGDITEPAGFDPGIELRGDVKDAERRSGARHKTGLGCFRCYRRKLSAIDLSSAAAILDICGCEPANISEGLAVPPLFASLLCRANLFNLPERLDLPMLYDSTCFRLNQLF
jgi:hypothetical protein